jgi:hypothetical protein
MREEEGCSVVCSDETESQNYPPSSNTKTSSLSGSGSFTNWGWVGLVGVVPVLENAPDLARNSESAAIPSLVPSRVGMCRELDAWTRMLRWLLYLGHSLMMWFLVSRISLSQGQWLGSGERGRKDRLNSPVYEWPVRHWRRRPNTSRFPWRLRKWWVELREGEMRLATAYRPTLCAFFQS